MLPRLARISLLLAGCAAPPPPPPPPPPPSPPPYPHAQVWAAAPGVALTIDSATALALRPATRLEVVGSDSATLHVRCPACPGRVAGTVSAADVLHTPRSPQEAASAGLADFALAVRAAAARRDLGALYPVMAPDFTFAFLGPQGREQALAAWRSEGFRALDLVPSLLDRGLATRDSLLWAAPPEHFEQLGHRGLRLGFRRTPAGAWEWLFLVSGERTE